jgi:uncharacterized protein (TIRG00374 family)
LAVLAIKITLGAAVLYWLLASNRLSLGTLGQLGHDVRTLGWMAAGVASVLLGHLLLAWRLVLLFRRPQLEVSFWRSLALTLIGSLTGAVLPGLVGGDAVKAVYLCGDAVGRRSHAVATVLVDRVLGLYGLFLLATIMLGGAWCTSALPPYGIVLWAAPLVTAVLTTGLVVSTWPGNWRRALVATVTRHLPAKLQSLAAALEDFLQRPGLLWASIGLSLANHGLVVLTFVVAAAMLHDPLPLVAHFVLSPLAMAMNMIPLTPGGVGLAEGAFSFLYQYAGSTQGAAVGLLGRVIQYAAFAVGGTPALLGARWSRPTPVVVPYPIPKTESAFARGEVA